MTRLAQYSTRSTSNLVGAYYVLTIALGILILLFHGRAGWFVDFIAIALYLIVTAMFYSLSKR